MTPGYQSATRFKLQGDSIKNCNQGSIDMGAGGGGGAGQGRDMVGTI